LKSPDPRGQEPVRKTALTKRAQPTGRRGPDARHLHPQLDDTLFLEYAYAVLPS